MQPSEYFGLIYFLLDHTQGGENYSGFTPSLDPGSFMAGLEYVVSGIELVSAVHKANTFPAGISLQPQNFFCLVFLWMMWCSASCWTTSPGGHESQGRASGSPGLCLEGFPPQTKHAEC